ncbi:hypothetical protein Tco_0970580 [Tanacetum coccineum]
MELYHSRLTQDDLNELIIKYKIPRDLHPWLPSEEFVMSEIPDDAIGVYHRVFDFFGVRIPFSSFLLSLIKHYKVHFSQLGPLALNKVVTFERLSNAAIDDPKPSVDSYNREDVRRMSAHVVNLQDIPEGVLVLSGLSRVWKSRTCDPVLRGADGNVMGIHDFLCLFEWTGVEDLTVGTPSAKVLAKADSLKKRKALLSEATSSHSGGSVPSATEGPNARDDRDKTIMTDAAVAPTRTVGRFRSGDAPAASFRDVSGDAIHRDFFPFSLGPYYATYSEGGIAGNCEFSHEEWDAPHQPTLTILTKEVFKDPSICKTVMDQFPTPGEMVRIEALTDDQLNAMMSDLHYLMMSHGGIYWPVFPGPDKSTAISGFHKQVADLNGNLSISDAAFSKSKFKGKEQKKKIKFLTKNLDQLNVDVARLTSALNQANVVEAEQDAEILRLKASPPELVSFFVVVFKAWFGSFFLVTNFAEFKLSSFLWLPVLTEYSFLKIFDHAADPLFVLLQLEPEKLARLANLPFKAAPSSPTTTPEQNEELINAMADVPDNKMKGDTGRVSFNLSDVVITLSAGEKDDGSLPSSGVAEKTTVVAHADLGVYHRLPLLFLPCRIPKLLDRMRAPFQVADR